MHNHGSLERNVSLAFRGGFRKPCAASNLKKFFADPISGGGQDQKLARLQMQVRLGSIV
jgi:hypothetical protein